MLGFIVRNPQVPTTGRFTTTYNTILTNLFNAGASCIITQFGADVGTGTFDGTAWTITTYTDIKSSLIPANAGIISSEKEAISKKDNYINTQEVANYTINRMDSGTVIEMNYPTANTVTIPNDPTFPINGVIMLRQMGVGVTTVIAGSGITLRNPHGTAKLYGQYASAFLQKRGAAEWCLEGNLSEV